MFENLYCFFLCSAICYNNFKEEYMTEFHVVEGKLSEYYNHFADYSFTSCEATETRLMGAVAFRVTWTSPDNPRSKFYQVFHLDYSEYGVDDYYEFICSPDSEGAKQQEDMSFFWKGFIDVMGGRIVNIQPEVLLKFVDAAIPLAHESHPREYDNEENKAFRKYAIIRLNIMKDALITEGLFENSMSENKALSFLVPKKLGVFETINYFIMRLIDLDFSAASYLSSISESQLRSCPLVNNGIQALIRSSIRTSTTHQDLSMHEGSVPFRCKITSLSGSRYYFSSFIIWLEEDYAKKSPKVTDISVGYVNKLSDYEAALQIAQTEHITVFDCQDSILDGFDGNRIPSLVGVEPKPTPNGWLFTVYNSDNSHVDTSEYRLGDDVYGYALLTLPGEFIIMSNKMMNISVLDNSTVMSLYSPYMTLKGRFTLDTPIFQTLCQTTGAMFKDLVETDI